MTRKFTKDRKKPIQQLLPNRHAYRAKMSKKAQHVQFWAFPSEIQDNLAETSLANNGESFHIKKAPFQNKTQNALPERSVYQGISLFLFEKPTNCT